MKKVVLIGGPADGETFEIHHGDKIAVPTRLPGRWGRALYAIIDDDGSAEFIRLQELDGTPLPSTPPPDPDAIPGQ